MMVKTVQFLRSRSARALVAIAVAVALASIGVSAGGQAPTPSGGPPSAATVKRGEYLVSTMGCHDCHTPMKMGPNGPEPDMTRALSGHPPSKLPPPPAPIGPWIGAVTDTFTAWAGPWGISYSQNITPDPDTGIGNYTEEQFVMTIREGKKQGRGRALLPPMPWPVYRNLTDDDLKAVYAYLRTVKPIRNKVPDPVVPGK
jgi:mono/diheme cytochrome c family protein